MAVDVLVGLQWGDEGKGKVVDLLAPKYDIVARFQGGPNAGHTLEFDGIKHVLHQIPSGIFRSDIVNVVGNGVVLDPTVFIKELNDLEKIGVTDFSNLFISKRAQVILPTHKLLDAAYEKAKGNNKIGSTLRGIGPAYEGKTARTGLRVGDLASDNFEEKYKTVCDWHKMILSSLDFDISQLAEMEEVFFTSVTELKKLNLTDTEYLINEALKRGENILAEGAQGSLLDVDFGTYPFVTSSNTIVSGACTGLGIAPTHIRDVFGVFKAYCTRVGSGPFPTELDDEMGEKIRQVGSEFGATTGRTRRCGWLDLPALKYAVMLNGVTKLMMMKADILEGFEEINLCTDYNLTNGESTNNLPYDLDEIKAPVYKSFPKWVDKFREVKSYNDLSADFIEYVKFIEDFIEVPINLVSVGPDRTENIFKDSDFLA